MLRKSFRWARKHPKTSFFIAGVIGFLALNILAFMHAYAMTHFVDSGIKPKKPEELTALEKVQVLFAGVKIPKPANGSTPSDFGLTFSAHTIQTRDSVKLEAWHIPRSSAMRLCILFHGYATCKASLLNEAKAFHDLDYETLLVDCRGCGGSEGFITTVGYREAEDVRAAVEYARSNFNPRPPILYGQSMGSSAILRAIATHGVKPEVVIVECPFDRLLSTVQARFRVMGVPSFPSAQLLVFWGGVQQSYWAFGHNPAEYARQVNCPVLLLNGADDQMVTSEQAETIHRNLSGPKKLVLFEGVGHQPCLKGIGEKWLHAVVEFLKERPPIK